MRNSARDDVTHDPSRAEQLPAETDSPVQHDAINGGADVTQTNGIQERLFDSGRIIYDPEYESVLGLRETEVAIKFVKDRFQDALAEALNLARVSAPMIVPSATGLNDHLDGIQKPIVFTVKSIGEQAAKWKRAALADYGFECGEGLFTDMNALRPDEALDNLHSVYVDQWDWERIMRPDDRHVSFLREIVTAIYGAIRGLEAAVCDAFPALAEPFLPERIEFVHSQELENLYPDLSPRERENAICREKGAVFVIGIGHHLESGIQHDDRAADYDDWISEDGDGRPGLNGDILVWYPVLQRAFELSSMGIRVNADSLRRQVALKHEEFKLDLPFHRALLGGDLPQTIGGGIGQSRLCMMLLRKAHVGEVQASVWPEDMRAFCAEHGMKLL
jgi:aspartate--ammonia ligase